jgi:ABC-type sulfate transport system permease component
MFLKGCRREMDKEQFETIRKLKWHSTWALLGLLIVTLGIYAAYYIKRQTKTLNDSTKTIIKIPNVLVVFIFIISYLGAFVTISSIFFDEKHPIQYIDKILTCIWIAVVFLWALYAKNSLNALLNASKKSQLRVRFLWTLLFGLYYLNYKVNKLNKYILTTQPI